MPGSGGSARTRRSAPDGSDRMELVQRRGGHRTVAGVIALTAVGSLAAGCSSGGGKAAPSTTLCISLDSTPCPAPTAKMTVHFPASESPIQLQNSVTLLFKPFASAHPPLLDAVIQPQERRHEIVVIWENKPPTAAEVQQVKSLLMALPSAVGVEQS